MKIISVECCSPLSDCQKVTNYLNQLSDSRYHLSVGSLAKITSGSLKGVTGRITKRIFVRQENSKRVPARGKYPGVPGYSISLSNGTTATATWNQLAAHDR